MAFRGGDGVLLTVTGFGLRGADSSAGGRRGQAGEKRALEAQSGLTRSTAPIG